MLITNTTEKSYFGPKRHNEPDKLDLKEWTHKSKISRKNTNSRRFSASGLKSSREKETCFASNITICSTVSSPGYTIRDEINPSTYSFTTALKALQSKTMYTCEYLSPQQGLTLNSKWNEAEKYICNPLSGQVPLECLSSKTLRGRSFRNRITMSAPSQVKSPIIEYQNGVKITVQDIKRSTTKDSTQVDLSSSSPSSPAPTTPSIEERPIKQSDEDLLFSTKKLISENKCLAHAAAAEAEGASERQERETRVHKEKEGDEDDDDDVQPWWKMLITQVAAQIMKQLPKTIVPPRLP